MSYRYQAWLCIDFTNRVENEPTATIAANDAKPSIGKTGVQ